MKRFVVDQRYVWITAIMDRLYQRPSPEELKEMLPNVYNSLSEEVKENGKGKEVTALFKVHASLLMATAEQMMIIGKVGEIISLSLQITAEQYDLLQVILSGSDRKKRDVLLGAAENYKKFGKYDEVGMVSKNHIVV